MGSESILSAFQSAFPSLYSAEPGAVQSIESSDGASLALPAEQHEQQPRTEDGEQLAAGDSYSQKIQRITSKVGKIEHRHMHGVLAMHSRSLACMLLLHDSLTSPMTTSHAMGDCQPCFPVPVPMCRHLRFISAPPCLPWELLSSYDGPHITGSSTPPVYPRRSSSCTQHAIGLTHAIPSPPLQFHTPRASADELEAYLKGQEVQAKEAEFLALARADDGERRRPCGEGGAKDNVVGF